VAQGFGDGGAVALALTTGVLTAFNPCGFAMLPAYVSYFVGSSAEDSDKTPGTAARIARAGVVGSVVTLGFVTVFGLLGIVASGLRSTVTHATPYIAMVVGIVLIVLSISMLRGFEPKLSFIKIGKAREGSGLWSMYVYGVSYALVSLSCAFPAFLATVASAFREESIVKSLQLYVAFAAGMGLVLLALTIAVSVAQQSVVRGMRKIGRYVNRLSGVLLLFAGLYVTWYGYYEYRLIVRNDDIAGGPVDNAFSISGRLQNWFANVSSVWLTAGLVAVVATVGVSVYIARTKSTRDVP
jgi:cytochrome c-type biogenesis protein